MTKTIYGPDFVVFLFFSSRFIGFLAAFVAAKKERKKKPGMNTLVLFNEAELRSSRVRETGERRNDEFPPLISFIYNICINNHAGNDASDLCFVVSVTLNYPHR